MGKFDDPVFIDPSKFSPEELKAHELKREAWRRAIHLKDYTLGIELGLYSLRRTETGDGQVQ